MSNTETREPQHYSQRNPMPTAEYDGRRLVLARSSGHWLLDMKPNWSAYEDLNGSSWNVNDFERLVSATWSPDCTYIFNFGIGNAEYDMWTARRLDRFDELLDMLSKYVGWVHIHDNYDVETKTVEPKSFRCNGGNSSIHLIGKEVWHELFQIHSKSLSTSINDQWADVLMTVGGLPEKIKVNRGLVPLVTPDFECPYDQIVEIHDHPYHGLDRLPLMTAYPTTRVQED